MIRPAAVRSPRLFLMTLLTPGPTPIPDSVRAALGRPAVAHRDPSFERVLKSCCDDLKSVFRTGGDTPVLTGSGTTAVESVILSLIDPERPGTVVACHSGKFGERWLKVAERLRALVPGLRVASVEAPWGEPITPEQLERELGAHDDVSLVTAVHSETSTATASDLEGLARVVRDKAPDALLVADGITSVGAMPVETDAWGVDAVVAASQKSFMLPCGLGFVAIGPRATARLDGRPGCAPLAMDLRAWRVECETGRAPYTPATSLVMGLRAALDRMLESGVEAVWERTRRLAEATRGALEAAGFELASTAPSDALTAVLLPEGATDAVRATLRDQYDVWLAGGQNAWKGRVVRLSHMGAVTAEDTARGVTLLCREAERAGAAIDAVAGEREIRERLASASPAPA